MNEQDKITELWNKYQDHQFVQELKKLENEARKWSESTQPERDKITLDLREEHKVTQP